MSNPSITLSNFVLAKNLYLIKRDESLEKVGSIFIPKENQEERRTGKIISIGTQKNKFNNNLSEGDNVLYDGKEVITIEDIEYNIVIPENIILKYDN